jgi:hypothetical protein
MVSKRSGKSLNPAAAFLFSKPSVSLPILNQVGSNSESTVTLKTNKRLSSSSPSTPMHKSPFVSSSRLDRLSIQVKDFDNINEGSSSSRSNLFSSHNFSQNQNISFQSSPRDGSTLFTPLSLTNPEDSLEALGILSNIIL